MPISPSHFALKRLPLTEFLKITNHAEWFSKWSLVRDPHRYTVVTGCLCSPGIQDWLNWDAMRPIKLLLLTVSLRFFTFRSFRGLHWVLRRLRTLILSISWIWKRLARLPSMDIRLDHTHLWLQFRKEVHVHTLEDIWLLELSWRVISLLKALSSHLECLV